ncbi:hypothetical protein JCM8097_008437 [Rhodosporidiobolus ruineniae]
MRSFAALAALAATPATLALSFSSNDAQHARLGRREHHQHAHAHLGRRMARKVRRQDGASLLSTSNSTSSASTSSAESYSTTAIWYAEAGWVTSCGVTLDESQAVVGLPLALYPNVNEKSDLCGQTVVATNPATGASVTATVVDASNRDDYTIFSSSAYTALGGDLDVGELAVTFSFSSDASVSLPASSSTTAASSSAPASSNAAASSKAAPKAGGAASTVSDSAAKVKGVASTDGAAIKAAVVPSTTTAAPTTTTQAPKTTTTSAWDSEAYYASQAAASSSSAAAAAAAEKSKEAEAAAASSSSAAAYQLWAASSSSSAAAAAASKSSADAAWADSSSSSAAAAAKASAEASSSSSSSSSSSGSSSSSSSASGKVYTGGIATFFYQNGVAGNCGTVHGDDVLLVALPTNTYASGSHCGQYVTIERTDTGDTINALVADSCPTCNNDSCLDLSWGAFSALGGTQSMGVFDIKWWFD